MLFANCVPTILLVLTSITFALAVEPPVLDSDARTHHDVVHGDWIASQFLPQMLDKENDRLDYYSHYLSSKPELPHTAIQFSSKPDQGPVHATYSGDRAFVTTVVPHTSKLGRDWGLHFKRQNKDGEFLPHYDAYLFWEFRKDRDVVKLLRFDLWPERPLPPPTLSWPQIRGILNMRFHKRARSIWRQLNKARCIRCAFPVHASEKYPHCNRNRLSKRDLPMIILRETAKHASVL